MSEGPKDPGGMFGDRSDVHSYGGWSMDHDIARAKVNLRLSNLESKPNEEVSRSFIFIFTHIRRIC